LWCKQQLLWCKQQFPNYPRLVVTPCYIKVTEVETHTSTFLAVPGRGPHSLKF
jgi:hypothetical protein